MEIHNVVEELVFSEVERACADIDKEKDKKGICTCPQCRLDAACYVLNRVEPRYIVSSRGLVREDQSTVENQQKGADITSLVFEALGLVGKNRRPGFDHSGKGEGGKAARAYFNFPMIIGRLFNGQNFDPACGVDVELVRDGKPVTMKDANWQNPCGLNTKTAGAFTFWPESESTEKAGERKLFHFSIKAAPAGLVPLNHVFTVPVISEHELVSTVAMHRTHKLADLYLFESGEEDE